MEKQINKFGLLEVVILIILTCVFSVITGLFLGNKFLKPEFNYEQVPAEIDEIVQNYNYIIENFYDDIDKKSLTDGAIKGMIESLGDKYTSFIESSQSENFNIQLAGAYEGIGAEVVLDEDNEIIIINIFEGSPADKAGLKVFDKIIEIDNEKLENKNPTDFVEILKPKKGSIKLTIKREEEIIKVNLKKEVIEIKSVHSKIYNKEKNKIGYLKVDLFAENTYSQFKRELIGLEDNKINSLIIDLRYNNGGHLQVVEKMISLFLDTSHIIYQTKTKNKTEKFYSSGIETKKYPIVVLANNESASASELMLGALVEEYGAKFVGISTYGKGTVQVINDISSKSQYKITIKRWLTPKGEEIEGVGIKPHYEIEQTEQYYISPIDHNDSQLQTALGIILEM